MPNICSKAGWPVLRLETKFAQGHQYCPTTICTFSASREGEPERSEWPPGASANAPSGNSWHTPMLHSPRKKRVRWGADRPSASASSSPVAEPAASLSGRPSFTAA